MWLLFFSGYFSADKSKHVEQQTYRYFKLPTNILNIETYNLTRRKIEKMMVHDMISGCTYSKMAHKRLKSAENVDKQPVNTVSSV